MGPKVGPTRGSAVRTALRGVGRTLIGTGVLILLFVAYQLWGTNIAEARSQRELKRDFFASLPSTTVAPATTAAPGDAVPATTVPPPPNTFAPPTPAGEAVAIIKIPTIGVEKAVVEGTAVADLKKGPGHYIGTPLPGQPGNAAIAGHRTTYGAPFNRIDELRPGDPIIVTTRQGSFRYEMASQSIVRPSDAHVLDPTDDNRLTLTSCHPKYSARQRIVVVAMLVGAAAPAPPPEAVAPTTVPSSPTTLAGEDAPVVSAPPADAAASSIEGGLSGEGAPNGPAILWGLLAAAVFVAVWIWSRVWRRWPAYLLGAPVFLVVLFVFFENVSRLLPANI